MKSSTCNNCGITKFGTACAFAKKGACSNTMMYVLDRELDAPMDLEEKATEPLAGGMMKGYQCGMLWGASLAAGAQAHRLHGTGPQAEAAALTAAQQLVDSFRERFHSTDCLDISGTDPQNKWQVFVNFFLKGGTIRCGRKIVQYAPEACRDIHAALSEKPAPGPCNPVNCAAMLAKKMGASDQHAVMAAGLAGGIGLSGGACGALGAAIWLAGIQGRTEGLKRKAINDRISDTTDRFLEASGYEVECSAIVGRTFKGQDDHTNHLRSGGCSELIEALALAATGDHVNDSETLDDAAPREQLRPAA